LPERRRDREWWETGGMRDRGWHGILQWLALATVWVIGQAERVPPAPSGLITTGSPGDELVAS